MILGLYAPEEEKTELGEDFYDQLQFIIKQINRNDYFLLMANGRIGNIRIQISLEQKEN